MSFFYTRNSYRTHTGCLPNHYTGGSTNFLLEPEHNSDLKWSGGRRPGFADFVERVIGNTLTQVAVDRIRWPVGWDTAGTAAGPFSAGDTEPSVVAVVVVGAAVMIAVAACSDIHRTDQSERDMGFAQEPGGWVGPGGPVG